MKAFFLILLGSFLTVINVYAQSDGRYQRKNLQPDFFVPQGVIQQQEKLPPIRYDNASSSTETISHISSHDEHSADVSTTTIEFKGLSNTPEYKQNYDTYINNIKNIAQTGQAPDDPRLEEDLAKMNSNERFIVK